MSRGRAKAHGVRVELSAVAVSVTADEPMVLVRAGNEGFDALPSGPLERSHRTLESGLRASVQTHTRRALGYVEQLYSFGDRGRQPPAAEHDLRFVSIGYLALVGEARTDNAGGARWRNWYRYFPWEDWRGGKPSILGHLLPRLREWVGRSARQERHTRDSRLRLTFGLGGAAWNEERVLERYELLYEAGLVAEASRDRGRAAARAESMPGTGEPMFADHRRILATAIARLRGKIKYRPVVFELMPAEFSLLQLQRAVEALTGARMHKPNFRRLVKQQGLVEETGGLVGRTGGRPARLVRFRRNVLLERPAPGVKLPRSRDRHSNTRA